jgi:hypothetical protein
VTEMVPAPPSATTLGGPATVSWHFGGVGPIVTSDVVFESHPATISATVAIRPGRKEGYRGQGVANSEVHRGPRVKGIKASQHLRYPALCIPCASDLSRCSYVETGPLLICDGPPRKFFQNRRQERAKPGCRVDPDLRPHDAPAIKRCHSEAEGQKRSLATLRSRANGREE